MNEITETKPDSKTPTHTAYHVSERAGSDAFWTRIGSAWKHSDGQGFNLQIDAFPLNGRITLRAVTDKK